MYRRTVCGRCSSYHIPPLARVGIFPIHLDPPTQQHREIFKLLLGITADSFSTQPGVTASATTACCSSSSALSKRNLQAASAADVSNGHDNDGNHDPLSNSNYNSSDGSSSGCQSRQQVSASSSSLSAAVPSGHQLPSKFWYLESFAESLRYDSQLTPLDRLILVPNTRYPVSLRQSTHLAALAVLAARGLPRVQVDFTALEHPDDSMPVVYELAQRYHNSVLVHWLHDAYEMLNWRNFSEIKMSVPLLLLQTNSLPPTAVTKPPPASWSSSPCIEGECTEESVVPGIRKDGKQGETAAVRRLPLLHSRLYQDPKRVKDVQFADFYSKVADHIQAQQQYRAQQSHPALRQQQQRQHDLHVSLPSDLATRLSCDEVWLEHYAIDTPLTAGRPADADDLNHSDPDEEGTVGCSSVHAEGRPAAPFNATVNDVNQLVRGEWWLTKGGRGDDKVEVSRSYSNAASSSWLGAPIRLGKKRMGIDVSTDAALEDVDRAASLYPYRTSDGDCDAYQQDFDGNAGDEDELEGDEEAGEYTYETRDEALMDSSNSDFVITEKGLVEVTRGEGHRTVAAEASTPSGAESAEQPSGPRLPPPSSENGKEPLDSNAPRELFKEFAQVRTALEEMVEPTQVCHRPVTRKAGGHDNGRAIIAKDSAKLNGDKLNARRRRNGMHRVLDPNSVVSRRNVRELLEEIYPTLYFTHMLHRQQQQQQRQSQQQQSEEAGAVEGNSSSSTGLSDAAMRRTATDAPVSALSGRGPKPGTAPSVFAHVDSLLDEVALLHQSGTFPPRSSSLFSQASTIDGHDSSTADKNGSVSSDGGGPVADPMLTAYTLSEDFLKGAAGLSDIPTLPMVEVHPVTRCTGADVRQVLWEQGISPLIILTDAVTKYVESHGLYRDARKNADGAVSGSHVSSYASLFTSSGGREMGRGQSADDGVVVAAAARSPALMQGTGNPFPGSGAAPMSFPSASAVGHTASAAAASSANFAALKRMALQKEHAVMSFPGIIPRLELHYDKNNLLAREQYEKLKVFQCQDTEAPDLIVPIGGDGYMMHCIRNNWRRFIPFYGVNAGHVGYLLNDCATLEELFSSPLKLHTTNMLYCQAEKETETGERVLLSELAFNDAWVERSSGQTALIRILINGEERIRRLRGDGVLVSTAAGSTAYSQALGASPVPVGAPLIQVVGSNVVSPAQWRPVHLDQEDQVEFEVIDNSKRPCRCFVDSVNVGNVARMLVRSSRVAGVTLAFSRSCDLQHKLYQMQFPKAL